MNTAMVEAALALPIRPGDLAVGIVLDRDILRALVERGVKPDLPAFRRYRQALAPIVGVQALPNEVMDLLHGTHERYKDVGWLDEEELIRRWGRNDPGTADRLLEGWRLMHPPTAYHQRKPPRLAMLLDLLDSAVAIDRTGLDHSLSAIDVPLDSIRNEIVSLALSYPDRFEDR